MRRFMLASLLESHRDLSTQAFVQFDFDYYLIDEVMAVGDAQFKIKSKQVLTERLKAANVILTSHSMSTIRDYCNLVVFVDRVRVNLRAGNGGAGVVSFVRARGKPKNRASGTTRPLSICPKIALTSHGPSQLSQGAQDQLLLGGDVRRGLGGNARFDHRLGE